MVHMRAVTVAGLVLSTLAISKPADVVWTPPGELRPPLQESKEAALRENLKTMRSVLDQYRGDKARGPDSLEQLVREGYLRVLPEDPITESRATWRVIRATVVAGQAEQPAVVDLRSGAKGIASDGAAYSTW
jgi:general secretion pathway protein G